MYLTTGTFNYVVKDPNCIHLSGQLWIKELIGIKRDFVSSNLDCAGFRLGGAYCLLSLLLTGPA